MANKQATKYSLFHYHINKYNGNIHITSIPWVFFVYFLDFIVQDFSKTIEMYLYEALLISVGYKWKEVPLRTNKELGVDQKLEGPMFSFYLFFFVVVFGRS